MFSKGFILIIFAGSLFSCGYHFSQSPEGEKMSITIPYIQGDPESELNNELVAAFSQSGYFKCVHSQAEYFLQVVILSDDNDRIGYRYDRDNSQGNREKNIISVENRRKIGAQVTLFNEKNEVVFGPVPFNTCVDYDYADYGSPDDLETLVNGQKIPTIRYSYAQLNTIEGAHDDAGRYLYKKLSQMILQSIEYQICHKEL